MDTEPGTWDLRIGGGTDGDIEMELERQGDFQGGQHFMDWLVAELKEMMVEGEIIDMIDSG